MTAQKFKSLHPLIRFALGFFALGAITICLFSSVRFTGVLFLGIGSLLVLFRLLMLLSKPHPLAAKRLRLCLILCLCIGLTAAAITGIIIGKGSLGHPEENCRYVIVLGAGVNGSRPSMSLQERIDAAYRYLLDYPDAICVVSGGKGRWEEISEAQCMYNELTAMGIDPQRVWMEDQATNTRENLRFSLDLIESRTGIRPEEIGLVSSEYHLYRAGLFAQEEQVNAIGIPARTAWISLRINYFLREIAAVWYYTLLGG